MLFAIVKLVGTENAGVFWQQAKGAAAVALGNAEARSRRKYEDQAPL